MSFATAPFPTDTLDSPPHARPAGVRLPLGLLLSLLAHALLLSLTFGSQDGGLPGLGFPWQDRRGEVPDLPPLSVVLDPGPATAVPTQNTGPAAAAQFTGLPETRTPPHDTAPAASETLAWIAPPIPPSAQIALPPELERPAVPRQEAAQTEATPRAAERLEALRQAAQKKAEETLAAAQAAQTAKEAKEAQASALAHAAAAAAEIALAVNAEKAAQAETARTEALLLATQQEAVRQEVLRLQAIRLEADRQDAARAEATRLEAARQEALRKEAARMEATRLEIAQQETARETAREMAQEAARQLAARQAAAKAAEAAKMEEAQRIAAERLETARQETARKDAERAEASRKEAERLEAAKQTAARQETARKEAERAEAARQVAARQEALQTAAPTAAQTSAPAASVAPPAAQPAVTPPARTAAEQREERLRAIGRQLNEEADRREAAAAARPSATLPSSWSSARRGRIFGRSDSNQELVLYAEAWSRKIELNMTFDAVREAAKQPHTDPVVLVAVRSDGSVESISFVRTSGVPALDEAVRGTIQAQANYRAFPPALAREFDVVEIRRTWHFDMAIRLY